MFTRGSLEALQARRRFPDELAGYPPPMSEERQSQRAEEAPPESVEGQGPENGEEKPPTGFPEPPGKDPGDISKEKSPHSVLSNPATDPDPTEWPDPYDKRPDPRDPGDPDGEPFGEAPHPPPGATSTSEPHPSQDPEAGDRWEGPKRDKLDQ
jgi:hypothetical protein